MEVATVLNPSDFVTDLRLFHLSIGLTALHEHFDLIEKEIDRGKEAAECKLQEKLQSLNHQDEAEWDLLRQESDFQTEFVLPRVFRGTFLVSLFTVYETAIVEIAKLIQIKKGIQLSLDDLRGDLLDRAKKYYSSVLGFKLREDNMHWQRITQLRVLRNAIVHANGRTSMMRKKDKQSVLKIDGVSERFGYILIDEDFVKDTFTLIREELEALITRYKEWETGHRKAICRSP